MTTQAESSAIQTPSPPRQSRFGFMIALIVFVAIGILLAIGLTMDPRNIPSPLIGKPIPQFDLPALPGKPLGLKSGDLLGDVSLVNVFASWCVACRQEHPILLALSRQGAVPIHGLNYKDQPGDAINWLNELGDPYTRIGADIDGKIGIEWGVYGVPETFVIDKQGRIAYKHIGPISEQDWNKTLLPLIKKLRAS